MSILKVFFGITNFITSVASTVFLSLICKYIQSKPEGMKTILDLLVKDTSMIWILLHVVRNLIIYCGFVFGHLGYIPMQVLLFIYSNTLTLLFASMQITIVVKAVLIFKGEWFYEVNDSTIQQISRGLSGIYAILRVLIDYLGTGNSRPPIANFLTSNPDFET